MSPGLSRRRLLHGLAGLALAPPLALTVGCSRRSGSSSDRVEFWSQLAGSKKAAGIALAEGFAEAHPEFVVDESLYGSPDQLNQKLLTGIVGGILPDLFIQHWDYSLIYASGGKLTDLSSLLPQTSGLTPQFSAYSHLDGALVSAPLYGTSRALTMNADILDQAGIARTAHPTTWEELLDIARECTRWSGDTLQTAGWHLYGNDLELFETFVLLLQGAGGRLLSPDGSRVEFDSEAGIDAVAFLEDAVVRHRVTVPGFGIGDMSANPYSGGRAAFTVNGNYGLRSATNGGIDIEIALMPRRESGFTSLIDPFAFAIPAGAANVDGAAAYVNFALSREQQVAFALASRNIPALADAADDPALDEDPLLAQFVTAAEYAPPEAPVSPAFTRMVPAVARSIQNVLYGKQNPADAIRGAAAQIRPFVEQRD